MERSEIKKTIIQAFVASLILATIATGWYLLWIRPHDDAQMKRFGPKGEGQVLYDHYHHK